MSIAIPIPIPTPTFQRGSITLGGGMNIRRSQDALDSTVLPGTFGLLFVLIAAAWWTLPAACQEPGSKTPSAEDILDKYIQVTGGKAAYRSLHNILSRGTFYVTGTTAKGSYAAYEAEPNKTRTIYDFEGGEKDEQGTLGDLAWERSATGGWRILEGEERSITMREATFNSMLNWRSLYRKVENAGTETINDRACYKIVLTPASGKPLTQFFEIESGLLVKSFILVDSPAGEIRSENLYGDYRKDNVDVLFAHRLVRRIPTEEMVITLDSVRSNVDIAWYRFDPPQEIRALMRSAPRKP